MPRRAKSDKLHARFPENLTGYIASQLAQRPVVRDDRKLELDNSSDSDVGYDHDNEDGAGYD